METVNINRYISIPNESVVSAKNDGLDLTQFMSDE